jgi:hypothetical protein
VVGLFVIAAHAGARKCDRENLNMRNTLARGATLAFLLVLTTPVDAQVQALPLPPPPAPPLPTGNVQRALGGAYSAITGASATNPAAAEQANLLYQSALERYRNGDFNSANAEANAARSIAESAPTGAPPSITQPQLQNSTAAPARAPASLSDELLRAYFEIDMAADFDGPNLEEAKRHYRVALDAYLDGNRAKERREASASFDLAEQALEHPPNPAP